MEPKYFIVDTGEKIEREEMDKAIALFANALNAIMLNWTDAEELREILRVFPDAAEWINTVREADPDQQLLGVVMLAQLSLDIDELKFYLGREEIKDPSLFDFTRPKGQPDGSIERDIDIFNSQLTKIADEMKAMGELSPAVNLTQREILQDRVVKELLAGTMTPKKTKDRKGKNRYMVSLNQAPKKSKKKVPVVYGLTAPDGTQVITSRYLDGDDMDILETVGAIITEELLQGKHFPIYITPAEIWRKRNGIDDEKITPSAVQQQDIIDHMHKMQFTELFIDLFFEEQEHFIDQLKDDRIADGFVDTYFIETTLKGVRTEKNRIVEAYEFKVLPFLYKYNIITNHALIIDTDLLDTSDTTSGLEDVEPLRRYLISQIELMYNKTRDNNTIRYDTIYKDGGIKTPEERITAEGRTYKNDASRKKEIRRMAKTDRDHVGAILESWKKRQYILDYEQVKEGGKYTGVKIKLNPDSHGKAKSGLANWKTKNGETLKDII